MTEAYICDAVRTPIGRYGGALAAVRTDDLAAAPIRALMERNSGTDWDAVDDLILGCANQAGEDNRNVARMAVLLAGLPTSVPGATVNRLCGSGMQAVGDAARAIRLGEADLILGGDGLGKAIEDYQAVYSESWKEPEPYSGFMPDLIRTCADEGWLRLGNAYLDGKPMATQLYIVSGRRALMYKTAYDERAPRNLSIGGVLTLGLLEHVIEKDGVSEVDFGIGDEPYKAEWMTTRRE